MELAKIEERIDRTASGAIAISDELGGIRFTNMLEVMEFAKMLAISKEAVPQHLRGEPGMCLAVCIQALEWRFSPFAVANKSYVVNGRLAYESQLVHALIEQRAPITGRLRHRYEGKGDERVCIVWATPLGEKEPLEHRSSPIGKITPKNSPLWKTKPDVQLYYAASRDWARIYFPDTLLGVYAEDELRESAGGPEHARDITPQRSPLAERLAKTKKGERGFKEGHAERALEHKPGAPVDGGTGAAPQPEVVTVSATEAEQAGSAQSEKVAEWRAYLDKQIADLADAKSAEEIKGSTDGVKASLERGVTAGEIDEATAGAMLGEWNAAALTRQQAFGKKRTVAA